MENKMSYETLINNMLDSLEQRRSLCGVALPDELESKHSIIDRFFKKVREDMRAKCIKVVENNVQPGSREVTLEEIKKL